MGKLDEIAELLINELNSFDHNLKGFKKDIDKLSNINLSPNVENLSSVLAENTKNLKSILAKHEHKQKSLTHKLDKSKTYPNWLVALVFSSFLIAIGSVIYSGYLHNQIEITKEKAYNKGINDFETHISEFFEKHPKSYKAYKDWRNK